MFQCSSASRKFLNWCGRIATDCVPSTFQCSSASRKFLNCTTSAVLCTPPPCFSALQRAENSSMVLQRKRYDDDGKFQCSSASRKFLNSIPIFSSYHVLCGFSALQRAENSSIRRVVQFPEHPRDRFSALQRAENSSIARR